MSNRKLKSTKELIKMFLLSGGIYAILMAGYDWFSEDVFKIGKFLFHFLFFGGFMTFATRFIYYENQ